MSILLRPLLPTRLMPSVIRWQHKMPTAPSIYLPSVNTDFFVVKSLSFNPLPRNPRIYPNERIPHNPRMDERIPNNPTMDERMFNLTLVSATNLPGRRYRWPYLHLQKMKVYAEVSLITGDSPITIKKAKLRVNDRETTWNLNLKVEPMTLPLTTPNQTSAQLIVKLSRRRMGYPDIGHVDICVNTLLQKWRQSQQNVSQNYEIFDVEDTSNGKLTISYSFG